MIEILAIWFNVKLNGVELSKMISNISIDSRQNVKRILLISSRAIEDEQISIT